MYRLWRLIYLAIIAMQIYWFAFWFMNPKYTGMEIFRKILFLNWGWE